MWKPASILSVPKKCILNIFLLIGSWQDITLICREMDWPLFWCHTFSGSNSGINFVYVGKEYIIILATNIFIIIHFLTAAD